MNKKMFVTVAPGLPNTSSIKTSDGSGTRSLGFGGVMQKWVKRQVEQGFFSSLAKFLV